MASLEELASNEDIKLEYRKSLLLNILKKIIAKMRRDNVYCKHVKKLYKESTDKHITTKNVLKKDFNYDPDPDDIILFSEWINAYFNKSENRKRFPDDFKHELYEKQKGLCAVCGEPLESDYSKIHIDHIIPWSLVGDELKNNYQYLCATCNESKSCHTDFIFKSLLNLV